MTAERRVRICLRCRRVGLCEGGGDAVDYAGITISRVLDGQTVKETWVPFGTESGYADDEALIGHLRDA
jgi:hypothetical protein